MIWMYFFLGNKILCFMQFVFVLMIVGMFFVYVGIFNLCFLEDVLGIDQYVDFLMYEFNKVEYLSGKYCVLVVVNEKKMEFCILEFKVVIEVQCVKMGEFLVLCLSCVQFEDMGVCIDSFLVLKMVLFEVCVVFDDIIFQVVSYFDFVDQILIMSFLQVVMKQIVCGMVLELQWDEGVNVLLVDYNFFGSNVSYDVYDSEISYNSDSYYLNLCSGMNLGVWWLCNYSIWM